VYLVLILASRVVGLSVHLLCIHQLTCAERGDDGCHGCGHARVEDMIVYVQKLVVGVTIALKLRRMVARLFEALDCIGLDGIAVISPQAAAAAAVLFCVLQDDSKCPGKRLLVSFLGGLVLG